MFEGDELRGECPGLVSSLRGATYLSKWFHREEGRCFIRVMVSWGRGGGGGVGREEHMMEGFLGVLRGELFLVSSLSSISWSLKANLWE